MAAADTAKLLAKDNRTVVGGLVDKTNAIAAVPALKPADTALLTAKDGVGGALIPTAAIETDGVKTQSAFVTATVANKGVAEVVIAVDKTKVRKQFFRDKSGDPAKGKWCYVNAEGWPLKADGTKAKRDLSDAADAKTTALTAAGEAVTDFTQRPLPGKHSVSAKAQGYAPYIGWTAQKPY